MSDTTVVPPLQAADFAARLADMIPAGWCGEQAKANGDGGTFSAMLTALGAGCAVLISQIQYALAATRIASESDPELSLAAQDFFGAGGLPRPAGYSNFEYAAYIKANLFRPALTRESIYEALTDILPAPPRMIEPWNINDTGRVDSSFLDVDSVVVPGRVGAPEMRYQGFIEMTGSVAQQLASQAQVNSLHAFGTLICLKVVSST